MRRGRRGGGGVESGQKNRHVDRQLKGWPFLASPDFLLVQGRHTPFTVVAKVNTSAGQSKPDWIPVSPYSVSNNGCEGC